MQPKIWKLGLALLAICAGTGSALGAPGTITATDNEPLGGVSLGGTFTVTLRISGYTDTNEIDGFQFNVNYNSAVFSFVGGSIMNNDLVVGPDQQWLRKPNQEAATVSGGGGYTLDSANDGTVAGQAKIVIFDGEGPPFPIVERGTTASDGFLVSLDLMCNVLAAASPIIGSAFANGIILTDVDSAQAGSPLFVGTTVTCVPEPTTWVMLLAGTLGLFVFKFRRR